jgi:hypothetical protein
MKFLFTIPSIAAPGSLAKSGDANRARSTAEPHWRPPKQRANAKNRPLSPRHQAVKAAKGQAGFLCPSIFKLGAAAYAPSRRAAGESAERRMRIEPKQRQSSKLVSLAFE